MKKKFFGVAIVIALTVTGSSIDFKKFSTNYNSLLDNVEALANDEEATSKEYDCYSIFTGTGTSISCSTCKETTGTPPWYHFGSECTRK